MVHRNRSQIRIRGRYVQGAYFVESHREVVESGLIGRDVPANAGTWTGARKKTVLKRIYRIYPTIGVRQEAIRPRSGSSPPSLANAECRGLEVAVQWRQKINELTPLRYLDFEVRFGCLSASFWDPRRQLAIDSLVSKRWSAVLPRNSFWAIRPIRPAIPGSLGSGSSPRSAL